MLECKLRDASLTNMRLQVQLLEQLSGKKLKIVLPDEKNLQPTMIECDEDGVSFHNS